MILGLAAKLAIGLGLVCTAFTIATIVLAVQKSNVETDLEKVKNELEELKKQITTTTTITAEPPGPSSSSTTQTPPTPINYRLPRDVLPIKYDLSLHPDLSTGTFTGTNKILIYCTRDTSSITLHANQINIARVALNSQNTTNFSLDKIREFLIINSPIELKQNHEYTLTIDFNGIMKDKIVGLYSSTYVTENGTESPILLPILPSTL